MLSIGAALFYYKLRQTLLKIRAASLLQVGRSIVTNWGTYYKLGELLLQSRAVLQIGAKFITNWGRYCKFYKHFS